jgi:MoaA/NifB/PqqE/SkfB family radical SAM enzyme
MSQSGIYSDLKMAWHMLRDGGLPDAPKQVQIILSDLCNQNCSFCAYRMDGYTSNELFVGESEKAKYGTNNPVRQMPGPRAFSLLDECKRLGVEGLQFTGGGEPTVHKQHVEIFQRALDLGFSCSLVSNGVAWSPALIAQLREFAWVRVSLDAGTPETYARIRQTPPGNFQRVLDNVRRLATIANRERCVLGVGYVVTPDNWSEVRQATHLVREAGAAYIRLSAMFSPDNALPYQDIYQDVLKAVRDVKADYDSPAFTVYELFTDRLQDLFDGPPDYDVCAYQHFTAYVGGDLNAYRCCVLAYNKRGLIDGGNLTTRPFDEFWNSAERKADFAKFNARGCERCQFNSKNRAAAYILGARPKHAEFP